MRFETTGQQEIQAKVKYAPSNVTLVTGGSLPVRYDPTDPAGRIETVGQDQAAFSRWMSVTFGVALLGLAAFGALWWALKGARGTGKRHLD